MRGRRPKEAWNRADTAWQAELAYAGVGFVLVGLYFTLTAWPEDPVTTVAIPAGAAIGAAILVPFGRFLWCLLWQPWEDLKAQVGDLAAAEGNGMVEAERLVVVLRNYLRQGFELEAYQQSHRIGGAFYTRELDELEEWTHNVVTCLTEYGTKAHCEKFIEADKLCLAGGHTAHRQKAMARIAVLEKIIKDLDPPGAATSEVAGG